MKIIHAVHAPNSESPIHVQPPTAIFEVKAVYTLLGRIVLKKLLGE